MVEPVSAIVGLLAVGTQLGIKVNDFISNARECPEFVRSIRGDVDGIICILKTVERAIGQSASPGKYSLAHKRVVFDPLSESMKGVLEKLSKLIEKYGDMDGIRGTLQRARWATGGMEKAKNLGLELSKHKTTLCALLQIDLGESMALIAQDVTETQQQVIKVGGQMQYVRDGTSSIRRNVHKMCDLMSSQNGNPMLGIPVDFVDVASTYEFDAAMLQQASGGRGPWNTPFNNYPRRIQHLSDVMEMDVDEHAASDALNSLTLAPGGTMSNLEVFYDSLGAMIDIIAVQGLSSASESAWTSTPCRQDATQQTERAVNWLKDTDMLPLEIPASRVLAFSYDSARYSTSSAGEWYADIARELLGQILAIRTGDSYRTRPILFIGHSIGGIIVEQALAIASAGEAIYDPIQQCTTGVIFLGTPHAGSNAASLATALTRVAEVFGLRAEQPAPNQRADEALRSVVHRFMMWAGRSSLDLTCFYETARTDYGTNWGKSWKEIAVSEQSACLAGHRKIPLQTDHLHLCKYNGPKDPSYQLVLSAILDMAREAPKKIERRFDPRPWIQDNSQVLAANLECQKALFVSWPASELMGLQRRLGTRTPGTCEWILIHEAYQEWLNGNYPKVLRVEGHPGTGKSMIFTFVLEQLAAKFKNTTDMVLATHICDHRNQSSNNGTAVLRQILFQLFQQRTRHFHFLQKAYDIQGSKLFSDYHKLSEILMEVLANFAEGDIYILLDALDECDEGSRRYVLDTLELIADSNLQVRILVLHRPESDLTKRFPRFQNTTSISLRSGDENLTKDVLRYHQDKIPALCKRRAWGKAEENLIQSTLKRKSEGSFLWSAFILEELERTYRKNQIRQVLNSLPADLWVMYKRITSNYSQSERDSNQIVLKLVAGSRRPLRKDELALAYLLKEDCIDRWRDNTLPTPEELAEFDDIFDSCGNMLRLEELNGTIRLMHESAREFLIEEYLSQNGQALSLNDVFLEIIFRLFSMENFSYLVDEDKLAFGDEVFKQEPPAPYLSYFFQEWEAHAHVAERIPENPVRWRKYLRLRPSLLDSWITRAYDTKNNDFASWLQLPEDAVTRLSAAPQTPHTTEKENAQPEIKTIKPPAQSASTPKSIKNVKLRKVSRSTQTDRYNIVAHKPELVKLMSVRRDFSSMEAASNDDERPAAKRAKLQPPHQSWTAPQKADPDLNAVKDYLADIRPKCDSFSWTQPANNDNKWEVSDNSEASETDDSSYLSSEESEAQFTSSDGIADTGNEEFADGKAEDGSSAPALAGDDSDLEYMVVLLINMMSEFSKRPQLTKHQAPAIAKRFKQHLRSKEPGVRTERVRNNVKATEKNASMGPNHNGAATVEDV